VRVGKRKKETILEDKGALGNATWNIFWLQMKKKGCQEKGKQLSVGLDCSKGTGQAGRGRKDVGSEAKKARKYSAMTLTA